MKIRQKNHGQSGTKLYNSWRAMKQRCFDKSQFQEAYQGKGISVCDEWMRFKPFMEWALENGYEEGLTIERIDPNKDYSPQNCEWITRSENIRRRNLKYDYSKRKHKGRLIKKSDGSLVTLKEYAVKNKKTYNTFRQSLKGMPKIINESELKNISNL